jgi:hypothetical protein
LTGFVGVGAGLPFAVSGATERKAGASFRIDEEEQRMVSGDQNLGVIAGGLEVLRADEESVFELVGTLKSGAEDASAEGVEVAGGGVHDDEAEVGEDFGEKAAEGGGDGCAGGVALAQNVSDGGPGEEFAGVVEGGFEMLSAFVGTAVHGESSYWNGARRFQVEGKGFEAGLGDEGYLVYFGEIVVFAGKPEDGDVRAAASLGGVLGFADRGGGLEEGKERASEERDLLAGNDGGGALLEESNVIEDGVSGVECVGLGAESGGEAGSVSEVEGGRVGSPFHGEGVRGIPAAQKCRMRSRCGVREVAEERGRAGQRRDGITLEVHAGISLSS